MKDLFRPACTMFLLLTVVTGVAYPALVTASAQVLFPDKARGSLMVSNGKNVGSSLIGQYFDDPKYFWGRPSSTSPNAYDASSSGASNLGPKNPALVDAVKARIEALRAADPSNMENVPVDLVTTSASGLDPHVSPAAALFQVGRVAKARGLDVERVRTLVQAAIEPRTIGVLGEPVVHVLKLNLALDALR